MLAWLFPAYACNLVPHNIEAEWDTERLCSVHTVVNHAWKQVVQRSFLDLPTARLVDIVVILYDDMSRQH